MDGWMDGLYVDCLEWKYLWLYWWKIVSNESSPVLNAADQTGAQHEAQEHNSQQKQQQ